MGGRDTVFFVSAGVFTLLVVGIIGFGLYRWWTDRAAAAAIDRRAAMARALRAMVAPLLQATPGGLTVSEIVVQTRASEEIVLSCLGQMVYEGLAHRATEWSDTDGTAMTRFVWGPAPPPETRSSTQSKRAAASPNADKPYEPPPQGLPERWLRVRRETVQAADNLDEVSDILHPFFLCKQCKSETTVVTFLDGQMMNDFAKVEPMLVKLSKTPEAFFGKRSLRCECGGKATLRRIVACRTNPTRKNDMHITIDSHRQGTPRVSFLMLDGSYEHLGDDGFDRVFRAGA